MKQSFAAAKYVLTNVLVLHPHPSARIPLSVDAFSSYFGTVLHQELAGSWAPGLLGSWLFLGKRLFLKKKLHATLLNVVLHEV